MTKPLRVYGYQGNRAEPMESNPLVRQSREIVAAKSRADARRKFLSSGLWGATDHDMKNFGCWTGNPEELACALAKPGTVFFRNLNALPGSPWTEAPGPEIDDE